MGLEVAMEVDVAEGEHSAVDRKTEEEGVERKNEVSKRKRNNFEKEISTS